MQSGLKVLKKLKVLQANLTRSMHHVIDPLSNLAWRALRLARNISGDCKREQVDV